MLSNLDTPSLLVDADALGANIKLMSGHFANRHAKLRPHFKSHKCTTIAKMQMNAGAVGITCAKLGEAEVLATAGIKEILIANEIVGPLKVRRLIELSKRANPIVAADSADNLKMISDFATNAGATIRALIEVDVGQGRCGVAPGKAALELARFASTLPGIQFAGLQGYEGHVVDLRDEKERTEKTHAALKGLVDSRRLIENSGIPVQIVSGGGTGTYIINGDVEGIDEVQAGSYALMDWWYTDIRPEFRQAMSILVTVISRPRPNIAIIDVGRKGCGAEWGPPRVKTIPGAKIPSFNSEEHGTVHLPDGAGENLRVGDHIEIIPSHGCTTSNLYREFAVHRNGSVIDRWPIEASGTLQ
ncbi:MAG: Alanine racemase domain protein [Verrucomicrobiales bacterium]|nr:Alanine racemase domain protein [Verrucomicrobiales bacterium]